MLNFEIIPIIYKLPGSPKVYLIHIKGILKTSESRMAAAPIASCSQSLPLHYHQEISEYEEDRNTRPE